MTPTAFDPDMPLEPTLRALYAWWDAQRGARAYPDREDLDPGDLKPILDHLVLVETADRLADFRYRVFGTACAEAFGEERTGRTLNDIRTIDNYDVVVDGYRQVHETGAPHYLGDRTIAEDRSYAGYARLLLPLGPDDAQGRPRYVIGALAFYRRRD